MMIFSILLLLSQFVKTWGQQTHCDSVAAAMDKKMTAWNKAHRAKKRPASTALKPGDSTRPTNASMYQSPQNTSGGVIIYGGSNITVNQNTTMYVSNGDTSILKNQPEVSVVSASVIRTTNDSQHVFRLLWPTASFLEAQGSISEAGVPSAIFTPQDFPYKKEFEWWKIWKVFTRNKRLKNKTQKSATLAQGMIEANHLMNLIRNGKASGIVSDSTPNIINVDYGGSAHFRIEAKTDSFFKKKFWTFDFVPGAHVTTMAQPGQSLRLFLIERKKKTHQFLFIRW